ncbi:MAG: MobQ family relaxase [Acetatifactor sp.]
MALYHFNVTQVSRGAGQTAVSAAAYRSGEKLHDYYYDEDPDYRRKGGVLYTEILLPAHAPQRLADRETLWNELEVVEKHSQAQLCYSFNAALQNEFTYVENLELARRFVMENFVARGMIVDLAIHDPDKGEEGIPNPHFHVLSPIRPLKEDGTWGYKQRREYLTDENGEPLKRDDGKEAFNAVSTTDWGEPETLLEWRKNWADLVNQKFEEKGLPERIDHRSNEERGLDEIPSIHEGPTVRAMEKKGIRTDKGDFNRLIKTTNALLKKLRRHIGEMVGWIQEFKEALAEDKQERKRYDMETKTLAGILDAYYQGRNEGAYSRRAKTNNLKQQAEILCFLKENQISTFSELEEKVKEMYHEVSEVSSAVRSNEKEAKEIRDKLSVIQNYRTYKPVYDTLCKIKSQGASDKFKEEHRAELTQFYMARRKMSELFDDNSVSEKALRSRLAELEKKHGTLFRQYHEMGTKTNHVYSIKKAIEADYKKAVGEPVEQTKKVRRGEER